MLRKLLFRQQEKKQVIIAIIGAFLGMTFLLTSIHYLIKVNQFGEGEEILGPNTLILQKKVGNMSTLKLKKSDFSPREIELLRKEESVVTVEPIINNAFEVSLQTTPGKMIPYFRTDVFLQTLDKNFLDAKSKNWKWKEGDTIVPLIMPREFLVMLNTFMAGKDIPKISDELAMQIDFKFTLQNKEHTQKEWVSCKIVGFTNEVSSLLVPETFMKWANNRYCPGVTPNVEQIMLSGKENEFGHIEEIMQKRGYESKKSQENISRLKSISSTLILIVLAISVLAVFLAGLVLIQYLQLLLSRNTYEIRTLLRLGHAPNSLIREFVLFCIRVFGIISGLSLISFLIMKSALDELFRGGGIYINESLTFWSIASLLIAFILFIAASFFSSKKGVLNTDKTN